MKKEIAKKDIVNDAIIKDLNKSVLDLKYGTVTIVIHDSKIVQLEITRKNRFDDIWTLKDGGGI